ncbi:PREDICTED: uncharacterized protein LOC107356778 [Acropora digitifera]|uniref:uncharacterized protein LOC107356778 n=1 Tax=Acropora digitifera TaxID=70779 RepID=UPI00077A78A2|nr:PREDICTED: uncharacterized protein LOC107356778 [Acropora digitifera]
MQQLLLAATKSDAEAAYNKENKEPKQSAKPPHKKTKKAETVPNKPLEKEKQRKKAEKGKQTSEKKKSQAQEERELKASIQKAQREQMKEVLKETTEMNYEIISDDISDDDDDHDVPVAPLHPNPKITVPKAATPRNSDQGCCQQCGANKDAIQRNSQALQILQQGISALKNEIECLKRKESSQSLPSIMSTPISSKKNLFTTGTPHPSPVLQCSINSSPESSHASIIDEKTEKELTAIPHHLKSKAAGANVLKKAARILAVGLFTVEERCSCTVSGSSNKSKQDNKRPQFDIERMSLIHEFLQKTYPKTHQHGEVNRIIGQVAIESRQGRHATDDSIVVAMLQGAK